MWLDEEKAVSLLEHVLQGYRRIPQEDLKYVTVHKTRQKAMVVKIDLRVIFGRKAEVVAVIEESTVG